MNMNNDTFIYIQLAVKVHLKLASFISSPLRITLTFRTNQQL